MDERLERPTRKTSLPRTLLAMLALSFANPADVQARGVSIEEAAQSQISQILEREKYIFQLWITGKKRSVYRFAKREGRPALAAILEDGAYRAKEHINEARIDAHNFAGPFAQKIRMLFERSIHLASLLNARPNDVEPILSAEWKEVISYEDAMGALHEVSNAFASIGAAYGSEAAFLARISTQPNPLYNFEELTKKIDVLLSLSGGALDRLLIERMIFEGKEKLQRDMRNPMRMG